MQKETIEPKSKNQISEKEIDEKLDRMSQGGNESGAGTAARRKRATQPHLPGEGFAPCINEEVDAAAREYAEARDERMRLLRTELERKDLLIGVMKKHGLMVYEYDDVSVELTTSEKLKVKIKDADEEEE